MSKIQQVYSTLVISASQLPQVIQKPGILKHWLLKRDRSRFFLGGAIILLILFAGPLSQGIVDYLYPLDEDSFVISLGNLLNSPILREKEALRESRYFQLMMVFWGAGLIVIFFVLIRDLPDSIKQAEQKAEALLEHSLQVKNDNPLLSETLATTANGLRLKLAPVAESKAEPEPEPEPGPKAEPVIEKSSVAQSPAEIGKTKVVKKAVKKVRYVGANQRYRIDRALASGGSGVVYQAQDTVLERRVALKQLLDNVVQDPTQSERFKVEAKALALLNHAHILPVYDLFEEDNRLWMVMELLTAGTLKDKIEKSGGMDIAESIEIVKGIASGLAVAHQQGFVHRDIKPENILFGADGAYRITDFGIAKHRASTTRTESGLILGSPGYMSPEQAAGETLDARSDLYSLGITLYQMVTGRLPFEGDVSAVMAQHITKQAAPPSSINRLIDKELDQVIMKMLEKKPDDRYASMQDLVDALSRLKVK